MNHRIAVLVCCLALAPALVQGATNSIANPGFDADLGQWAPTFGSEPMLSWSGVDELGHASGSVRFAALPVSLVVAIDSLCFPVTAGADLAFGASFWTSGASNQGGVMLTQIKLYDGAGCTGSSQTVNNDLSPYFSSSSTWRPLQGHTLAGPAVQSGHLRLSFVGTAPPEEVRFDNAFVYEDATCVSTSTVSCLGQRFRAAIEWAIPDGTRGGALVRPFSSDSLYASFFNPTNVEVVLKVLDGCSVNDRFWVFAAGLTNVHAVLRVTDTRTGATWTHLNPQDEAFAPVQVTSAFATCGE